MKYIVKLVGLILESIRGMCLCLFLLIFFYFILWYDLSVAHNSIQLESSQGRWTLRLEAHQLMARTGNELTHIGCALYFQLPFPIAISSTRHHTENHATSKLSFVQIFFLLYFYLCYSHSFHSLTQMKHSFSSHTVYIFSTNYRFDASSSS